MAHANQISLQLIPESLSLNIISDGTHFSLIQPVSNTKY